MKLYQAGFNGIKESKQTIEIRLNDEKRQKLNIGDQIEFTLINQETEKIRVEIIELLQHQTFQELFKNISLSEWNASDWTIEQAVKRCHDIYSPEQEQRHGVLGIRINKTKTLISST